MTSTRVDVPAFLDTASKGSLCRSWFLELAQLCTQPPRQSSSLTPSHREDEVLRVRTSTIRAEPVLIIHRLFFVSNPTSALDAALSTVSTILQGIETSSPTATRQSPWSLQYRVFRDTAPPGASTTDADGKPKPYAHTLQHHLHLTTLSQSQTYICIQLPSGKSTVTAIPLRQQEAYASLIQVQFAALWKPRHVLSIPEGITYSSGLCTMQVGELRFVRRGPSSNEILSPGIVVCIGTEIGGTPMDDETGSKDNDDELLDFEYAQAIIRECWAKIKESRDLGRSEVREVMMAQENVNGVQETEAAVRMWSEVLKLRG